MSRSKTGSLAVALAALLSLAVRQDAWAQAPSNVEQAKTQFTLGAQAYTAARYDVAVSAFEEAYRLLPRPEILFSLAQAEKKQCVATKDANLLKKALGHYRQYYAMDVPQNGRKVEAVEAIQYLDQLAAQPEYGGGQAVAAQKAPTKLAVFSSADGAHVYVDGRSQGDVPFVGTVPPGKHSILVRLEGFVDAEREVLVPEGTTQTIPMPLVERPVGIAFDTAAGSDVYVDGRFVGRPPFATSGVPLPPGNHVVVVVKNGKRLATKDIVVQRNRPMVVRFPLETSNQRVAAYAVGGLGVVSVVGSAVFFGIAFAEQARAETRLAALDTGTLESGAVKGTNTAIANRDAFRTAGSVAGVTGLVALGTGIGLFLFDTPDPKSVPLRIQEEPKAKPKNEFDVAFVPMVTPGAEGLYGLSAAGRF